MRRLSTLSPQRPKGLVVSTVLTYLFLFTEQTGAMVFRRIEVRLAREDGGEGARGGDRRIGDRLQRRPHRVDSRTTADANVARRTREIGVRVALGAQAAGVVGFVLRRSLVSVAGGIGIGLVIALVASRTAASLLYQVSPHDALAYFSAAGVLLSASIVAAWLPALRAARVDPVIALRSE